MGILLLVALGLSVVIGSWLGIAAYRRLNMVEERLKLLELSVRALRSDRVTPAPEPQPSAPIFEPVPPYVQQPGSAPDEPAEPGPIARAIDHLRGNWMVWLGGVSLGLAGVFLVVYSIEQGLLGPTARVVLGILAGLAMQGAAEYLRRRTGQSSSVFAALAAGGSIFLFAALLAALHLYQMIPLNLAFVCLTAVALATMALALLHGPMLAALGLLGAYIVPILVSSGSGLALIALVYALVISGAGLLLHRYVQRAWLWWGVIAGGLGWWVITLGAVDIVGLRSLYLTLFGGLVLMVPQFDWLLRRSNQLSTEDYRIATWWQVTPATERWLLPLFLALSGAHALAILVEHSYANLALLLTPLLMLALVGARGRESLNVVPFVIVMLSCVAWLALHVREIDDRLSLQWIPAAAEPGFLLYLTGTAVIMLAGSLHHYLHLRFKALWAFSFALTPPVLLVTGYLLTNYTAAAWVTAGLLMGLAYLVVASLYARRASLASLTFWLYFGGQLLIAIAAAISLTPDTLTVVLALQLVACAMFMRGFGVDLVWLIKVIATVLIVRLTLNPWLLSYPADSHWTLWTYGGSALLALIALRVLPPAAQLPAADEGRRWLEGVALHLGVLFLWTELRYWLHDGDVFASAFTATEAGLNVALFGAISVVYHLRAGRSEWLAQLYTWFSRVTGVLAAGSYGLILIATLFSLPWLHAGIAATPLWNTGLLLYLLPCGVFAAYYLWGEPAFRRPAGWLTGAAAFVAVNMEIRHLWTGSFRLNREASDAEMVTYSVVWLIIAVAVLLRGTWRANRGVYRAGMTLLALVIAKIFLLDMADLDGLLRVTSFLGLGFALLGLSYLHQRLS